MKFYDVLHNIFNFFVGFLCICLHLAKLLQSFCCILFFFDISKSLLKTCAEFF